MADKIAKPAPAQVFPDGDLSLQQHMNLLGLDVGDVSYRAKVPKEVVEHALQGGHIAQPHAHAICGMLNREHGLHSKTGFLPEHIKGLNVYQVDAKHTRPIKQSWE